MSVLYAYRCSAGNESVEAFFPLGQAPDEIRCEDHNSPARRQVSNGNFLSFPGSYKAASRKA